MRLIDADELSRDFCPGETYRAGEIQDVIDAAPTVQLVGDSEQLPRLLGLEEVKAIALREAERTLSTEVEPVWLEQNEGGMTRLVLVLISWWYMEGIDKDETEFEFIAKYFGTDLDDTLNYLDYGTRWRCWSAKPSKELRKVTPWS